MRTVGDEIQELAEPKGYTALTRSGYDGEQWMLYDFVDVIVHVFNDESRRFYDLENLWGDARRVDWRDGQATPPHQQ